jgi:hypothetical protein
MAVPRGHHIILSPPELVVEESVAFVFGIFDDIIIYGVIIVVCDIYHIPVLIVIA